MSENINNKDLQVETDCLDITSQEDEGNGGQRLFTQSQLRELISERLKRERKVNEALVPVKNLLNTLAEKGVIEQGSYSDMASRLVSLYSVENEDSQQLVHTDAEQNDSFENGGDANALGADKTDGKAICFGAEKSDAMQKQCGDEECDDKTVKENEKTGAAQNQTAEKEEKAEKNVGDETASFLRAIKNIREKYPDSEISSSFDLGLFEAFARGKNASVDEIFGDFCSFMEGVRKNPSLSSAEKNKRFTESKEEGFDENIRDDGISNASSTAFSSCSGTSNDIGLTKQQMEIAKSAGLSYKEYARLLKSIPQKTARIN